MMRYQRATVDFPITNGRKSNLRSPSSSKEDDCNSASETGRIIQNYSTITTTSFEEKGSTSFRSSPSKTQDDDDDTTRAITPPFKTRNGCDLVLQWGHKKRARVRSEGSSSSFQGRQPIKSQRRRVHHGLGGVTGDKLSISPIGVPVSRPPPPPPHSSSSKSSSRKGHGFNGIYGNGFGKEISSLHHSRNLEERSGAANGSPSRKVIGSSRRIVSRSSAGKQSTSPSEKIDRKIASSWSLKKDENHKGSLLQAESSMQGQSRTNHTTMLVAASEKATVEAAIEWPRFYLALSRKEKEDDFLAMKGTKLPQRPKKRAKNIDKTLQYCFPGMWLSDLTRSRYEVREKKSVRKQKSRGLKGMESMDSDSH